MKIESLKWILGCAFVGAYCLYGVCGETPKGREIKLAYSHVEAVNLAEMTFTVTQKATQLTVRISPETRFFLHGKPALSKDLQAGDHVKGRIRKPKEGMPEAVSIDIDKLAPK